MQSYQNMSDEELIAALRSGEKEITDYLMDKYKSLVKKKAKALYLIGGETDDLIQEGMIGLYKAVRDFNPDSGANFRSFADLCITRQIITAIKTATRQKHMPLNSYISLNKPAYDEDGENTLINSVTEKHRFDPEEIMINRERFKILEESLVKTLSSYETKVLKRYLSGSSYTVIASELGKSEKSIDNALQRIKKKLEKLVCSTEEYL